MSEQQPVEAKEFISSFKGFMDKVVSQAPGQEPVFVRHFRTHFATDPVNLPIISQHFEKSEHPNLHIALTELLEGANRSSTLLEHRSRIAVLGKYKHGMVSSEKGWEYLDSGGEGTDIAESRVKGNL